MTNNYLPLLDSMSSQLNAVEGLQQSDPQSILQAINIVAEAIVSLKTHILSEPFTTEQEEILFFKEIKPQFDGRAIFYLLLLKMDQCSPATSLEDKRVYYLTAMEKLQPFYEQHYAFWLYYRMEHTYLDAQYFLRNAKSNMAIYDEDHLHYDRQTNALMSAIAARIYGYELFKSHVTQELTILEQSQAGAKHSQKQPALTLTWTSPKAALIELIYALQEYGVFNNTTIDIKKITDYFSLAFNVKIANIYKTYEDIRLRKKSRTPFLDALRAGLEKRIDRDNENAM